MRGRPGSKKTTYTLLAIAALIVGCGGEPPTYAVTGAVTFNGKPLSYGTVRYYGPGGTPVISTAIDSSGTYSLQAPPAKYTVTVYAVPTLESDPNAWMYEGGIKPGAKAQGPSVPGKYSDIGTSPFRYEILNEESQTYDIDIPGRRQRM